MFIWLQIFDLHIGFNSECILKSIANFVGKFVEVDPKNFQGLMRDYLRIKVHFDVRRSLKSCMKIKKAGGEWLWINFKYERLPFFCFYCGIIGHLDKFCETLFDNHQANEERKYDNSLRAPIRKQGVSKGNQWLRDANGSLTILSPNGVYGRSSATLSLDGGDGKFPVDGGRQEGEKTKSRDSSIIQRESSNQNPT